MVRESLGDCRNMVIVFDPDSSIEPMDMETVAAWVFDGV